MSFGILSFLSPLPLLGLLALPVIWWLLRTTPPSPSRQEFPPTKILRDLLQDETTAAHSPWWLTLLRLVAAALIIFALAQPVLNSASPLLSSSETTAKGPLILVVDNGWSSASQWDLRKTMMQRLLREAQREERLVYLVPTAPNEGAFLVQAVSATDAMVKVEQMVPTAFHADRVMALTKLSEALNGANGGTLFWLSDGLHTQGNSASSREEIKTRLEAFASGGMVTHIVTPDDKTLALGLRARLGQGGALYGVIVGAPISERRGGEILALSAREEVLGRASFELEPFKSTAETKIELPLELRNQISKLRIVGQRSAGSVYLLDQRSNWRRIGLISNESGQLTQPLLSPLYYIRRALEPYGEIMSGGNDDVSTAVERLTTRNVSVIVMADVGRLVGKPLNSLSDWVEKGGVLVRFAGPHMEESQDRLLPTPLRQGGRRLGGALSWAKPQQLAAFDDKSPFAGLKVPRDVVVTRQLLADPSRLEDDVFIWARLKDGTPLVTAKRELDGWVVLLHVTANSEWSNLPLSGLFVEMLQRLSQLSASRGTGEMMAETAGDDQKDNDKSSLQATTSNKREEDVSNRDQATLLAPFRMLDGFGTLIKPAAVVEPVAFRSLHGVKIGPTHPPGFYGPPAQTIALNLLKVRSVLEKADTSSFGAKHLGYKKAVEQALRAPLFLSALILLIVDSLIVLSLRGVFSVTPARGKRSSSVNGIVVLLAVLFIGGTPFASDPLSAQELRRPLLNQRPLIIRPPGFRPAPLNQLQFRAQSTFKDKPLSPAEMEKLKLNAALHTHFAYVVTGNIKVDKTSHDGLRGLSYALNNRTAVEPAQPVGVMIEKDELAFYPILYWPVGPYTKPLSDKGVERVNAYMKQGGMIVFDTKDQDSRIGGLLGTGQKSLEILLSKLDIPRLEPVPKGHVLTKSFYLLSSFPGRYQGGDLWVEATSRGNSTAPKATSDIDGVSTLLITSNDLASAWAIDENYRPLYPVVPGARLQREMAYRVGVNIVMYALAGNYKADQVHVPALLERLGQ